MSIQEAAALLGVSVNTVRRQVKAGRLRSQKVSTPTGFVYRVLLETPNQAGTQADTHMGTQASTQPERALTPDLLRAEAMAAYNERLLAPLVNELASTRQQLVDQAETIGRLQAELSQAREQLALVAPASPVPSGTPEHHANGVSGVGPIGPGPKAEHAEGEPRSRWGRFLAWLYG